MEINNPLVTVIIAAYNAEKYIAQLLNSVFDQTYNNLEIIVVNDGSVDRTSEIVRHMQEIDKRLKLIDQSNNGVSKARNRGLVDASGEYIIFVDADDVMDKDMISTLFYNAQKNDADISVCDIKKCTSVPKITEHSVETTEILTMTTDEALQNFLLGKKIRTGAWNKLINRRIIGDTRFEEDKRVNEDKFFCFQLLLKCKTLVYTSKQLYYYMQRESSVTAQTFDDRWFETIYFSDKIYETLKDSSLESYARYAKIIAYYSLIKGMLHEDKKREYPEEYSKIIKNIQNTELQYIYSYFLSSTLLGIILIKINPFLFEWLSKYIVK